jgi:peptidoglycan/xylan/chitin deacetylase (PgdA/CDA1 family)
LGLPSHEKLTPAQAYVIKQALAPIGHGVVLGRRLAQTIGSSASRRAILPSAAWPELNEAALQAGEPVIPVLGPNELPGRVVYAPDLICVSPPDDARLTSIATPVKSVHLAPPDPAAATARLPILLYHRVTPPKSSAPARYQITPDAFKEQLQYLREAGYHSISLDDWRLALETKRPLPGRAVLFTFDGGYVDFLNYAWPWLKTYGFSATVLLVTGEVGGVSHWHSQYGEEVRLLDWSELHYLRGEGVEFGSLSHNGFPLTAFPAADVVRNTARSRQLLEQGLGIKIKAFAYPYGDTDQAVQHLVGACGYVFGLSRRRRLSNLNDPLLALPRIEAGNLDDLQRIISKSGV